MFLSVYVFMYSPLIHNQFILQYWLIHVNLRNHSQSFEWEWHMSFCNYDPCSGLEQWSLIALLLAFVCLFSNCYMPTDSTWRIEQAMFWNMIRIVGSGWRVVYRRPYVFYTDVRMRLVYQLLDAATNLSVALPRARESLMQRTWRTLVMARVTREHLTVN
jgi:hypothetical protein